MVQIPDIPHQVSPKYLNLFSTAPEVPSIGV